MNKESKYLKKRSKRLAPRLICHVSPSVTGGPRWNIRRYCVCSWFPAVLGNIRPVTTFIITLPPPPVPLLPTPPPHPNKLGRQVSLSLFQKRRTKELLGTRLFTRDLTVAVKEMLKSPSVLGSLLSDVINEFGPEHLCRVICIIQGDSPRCETVKSD